MTASCAACSSPPGDGFVLCSRCGDRLAEDLERVPDLIKDLHVTLARWDEIHVKQGRGGESGLPFRVVAADALRALDSVITFWTEELARKRRAELPPHGLVDQSSWLFRRVDWLRALENAGTAYSEIRAVVDRGIRAIDRPTHRARFLVGPCPEMAADGSNCTGDVWAYIPTREADPAVLRCRNPQCVAFAQPWTTEQWLRVGKRILRRMGRAV
jgi:hypothetical protein